MLGKGSILADSEERYGIQANSQFELHKAAFQKNDLNVGDVVHFCSDLQFVVGRITEINEKIEIEWDFPIVLNKSSQRNPLIIQLESKPRIMGFGSF